MQGSVAGGRAQNSSASSLRLLPGGWESTRSGWMTPHYFALTPTGRAPCDCGVTRRSPHPGALGLGSVSVALLEIPVPVEPIQAKS